MVILVGFAKEEEEQDRVEVALIDGGGRVGGRRVEVFSEVVEGGEEVASNEEGFVGEGDGVEVLEGSEEKRGGGEDGGEAAVVVEGDGEEGAGEI